MAESIVTNEIIYRTTSHKRMEISKWELVRLLRELTGVQVPHDDLTIYYDVVTEKLVVEYEVPDDVS